MLFNYQRFEFIGLRRPVRVVQLDGTLSKIEESYLDSSATSLMPIQVDRVLHEYLRSAQANSHTHASARGRATTKAIEDTRALVKEFVGGGPDDAAVFVGNGATGALNLAAQILYPSVPGPKEAKPLVLISEMEHHSDMLPWRRAANGRMDTSSQGSASPLDFVKYFPVRDDCTIDLPQLRALLTMHRGRVRVVVVSAMSNVCGTINPIHEIAKMAHEAGAVIVVDAAQAAPHVPIDMHTSDPAETLDFLALSGHKLYAPGSPGVLVASKDALSPAAWRTGSVGGGIVDRVELNSVTLIDDVAQRLEAGTPNIPGIIALGAALLFMKDLGMSEVREHEIKLTRQALTGLSAIPSCVVYGPMDATTRGGIVSFNLFGMAHGLVAAILGDFFGVVVRNDCFCAQPLVRRLLDATCNQRGVCAPRDEFRRGMVRASFSPFTTEAEVRRLVTAVQWIVLNEAKLREAYDHSDGVFVHKTFRPELPFDLAAAYAFV